MKIYSSEVLDGKTEQTFNSFKATQLTIKTKRKKTVLCLQFCRVFTWDIHIWLYKCVPLLQFCEHTWTNQNRGGENIQLTAWVLTFCVCLIVTVCVCTSCPTRMTIKWRRHSRASPALTAKDAHARRQPSREHRERLRTNPKHNWFGVYSHTFNPTHTGTSLSFSACALLAHSESMSRAPASVTDWVPTVLWGLTDESMGCTRTHAKVTSVARTPFQADFRQRHSERSCI